LGIEHILIGVDHLLFVATVLILVAIIRRLRLPDPRWAELVPPYAIGSIAMFWVFERVSLF
jgi:hypothetical protein